jgi:hypothetical protein
MTPRLYASKARTPAKKKQSKAGKTDTGQMLFEQRWSIHSRCPRNYHGSECYVANQSQCSQSRILQEPDACCPGAPCRWQAVAE